MGSDAVALEELICQTWGTSTADPRAMPGWRLSHGRWVEFSTSATVAPGSATCMTRRA
jgi:hypothetical protein